MLFRSPNGKVYKLIFKDFGGAANGNFVFTSQYIVGTSIKDSNDGVVALAIHPNPATDDQIQVVFDLGKNIQQADFQLFDIHGSHVFTKKLFRTEGMQTMTLPYLGLNSGIYIARLNVNGHAIIQKVIVQ